MLKIEFPANNYELARVIGVALQDYADTKDGAAVNAPSAETVSHALGRINSAMGPAKMGPTGPTVDEQAAAETLADSVGAYSAEQYEQHVERPQTGTAAAHPNGMTHDAHGVPFDPDYCGKAADPFYKSGGNKGQWKKRQGVEQSAYDQWYEASRPLEGEDDTAVISEETAQAVSQAAAVFGGATPPPQTTTAPAPANGGELMAWISAQQAAGNIAPGEAEAAYQQTGITIGALFDVSNPQNAATAVATIYGILNAKIGG